MTNCCDKMKEEVNKEQTLFYLASTRTYLIKDNQRYKELENCPWCNTKLPDDLTNVLCCIIYEGLELEGYDDPKLPNQYKSDKWWKRMGL